MHCKPCTPMLSSLKPCGKKSDSTSIYEQSTLNTFCPINIPVIQQTAMLCPWPRQSHMISRFLSGGACHTLLSSRLRLGVGAQAEVVVAGRAVAVVAAAGRVAVAGAKVAAVAFSKTFGASRTPSIVGVKLNPGWSKGERGRVGAGAWRWMRPPMKSRNFDSR